MVPARPPVKFLDLAHQHKRLQDEIDLGLKRIFEESSFVLGPAVEEFEQAFADYCGAKHCVTVSSGTAALHLSLLAMGVRQGDEVITAPNSFIATAEAISFCGATPRFVDVTLDTATINIKQISDAINQKTKVILPVHLYGQPVLMSEIIELARERGLKILEDACQAHGAMINRKSVGTMGDAGCFSFYPGKNLGAAGDGGAVITNDDHLAEKLRLLRNHGSKKKYHHQIVGHNFRLDSIQAAILKIKLRYLNEWNKKRQEIASYYNSQLKGLKGIESLRVLDGTEPVYHLYVIQVENRKLVEQILRECSISYGIHYPVPIHLQPAYLSLGLMEGSFPNAEMLSRKVLSLPIYPDLTREDQVTVIKALYRASEPLTK